MSRLLIVSNRLPVVTRIERGQIEVTPSAGGLATGLSGPHQRSGGLWIGWPGDVSRATPAQRAQVEAKLAELRAVPVHLSESDVARYYDRFSNEVLWPLFHYFVDRVPFDEHHWRTYCKVNERFAEAAAARYQPGDILWVHDYQLMLVPRLLRARLPGAKIGFFLHIPFPASDVFRVLPWRAEVLEGLLGADLIGFHTPAYAEHFTRSLRDVLDVREAREGRVHREGRAVQIGAFPMGVDAARLGALADEVEAEASAIRSEAGGKAILLGIDRLDYTKGIPRRLLAIHRLLERDPSLRGRVRLLQIAVPSRTKIPAYQDYRRRVDEILGHVNGQFCTRESVPIHFMHRAFSDRQLCALYRAAAVMLVTPLRDGMNLVAKEFVATRTDGDGALVLSEFAGAAAGLEEALRVNPYHLDEVAAAIKRALTMPERERRARMQALRARVTEHDVHRWAEGFIAALRGGGGSGDQSVASGSRHEGARREVIDLSPAALFSAAARRTARRPRSRASRGAA